MPQRFVNLGKKIAQTHALSVVVKQTSPTRNTPIRIRAKSRARLYWRTLSRITLTQNMDGIFGWLGDHGAHHDLIRHMGRAACLSPEGVLHEHSSQLLGVAACSRFGKADIHVENGLAATLTGRPVFLDDDLAFIARDRNPAMAVAH